MCTETILSGLLHQVTHGHRDDFFQGGQQQIFPGVAKDFFKGGTKMVKFQFTHSKTTF